MSTNLGDKLMTNPTELEEKLELFLQQTHQSCLDAGFEYIICGSMATYLQGCQIIPGDIDILSLNPEGVKYIVNLMSEYEAEESPSSQIEDWLSTSKDRVFEIQSESGNEQWYMARWIIDGVKVEIAFIKSDGSVKRSREKGYIWENGPDMYQHARVMDFRGYQINVVPLEIQIVTNMQRGLEDRVNAILKTLNKKDADYSLIKKAIHEPYLGTVLQRLKNLRTRE